ncbi:MAG: sensor domain-containing diguanylate cyclase [Thermodesulfovibrionales bacterium]|jgi:diguanylate cyclase (GGDEF)-like protein
MEKIDRGSKIRSWEFFRAVVDSVPEHIAVVDPEGTIQWVNRAWIAFGNENGAEINKDWQGVNYLGVCDRSAGSGDEFAPKAASGIRSVIKKEQDACYFEYPCHSPEEMRWFMMNVTPLQWEGPARVVISHQNITARKMAEEKALALSLTDFLTGLANRGYFDQYLHEEWLRAVRMQTPLSLILLDIDWFKNYNDNYGHQAGDACLIKVAEAIAAFGKRAGDRVARYGGEEFAIVLVNTDAEQASKIAENVCLAVRNLNIRHDYTEDQKVLTVSVGVATAFPQRESSEKILIEAADKALYVSKRNGRNRVSLACPMEEPD